MKKYLLNKDLRVIIAEIIKRKKKPMQLNKKENKQIVVKKPKLKNKETPVEIIDGPRKTKNVRYNGSSTKSKEDEKDKDWDTEDTEESEETDDSAEYDDAFYGERGIKTQKKKTQFVIVYPTKCEHCDEMIDSRKNHSHHYKKLHRDKTNPYSAQLKRTGYVCSYCGKVTLNFSHHQNHEQTHKSGKFVCPDCNKVCNTKRSLTNHRYIMHAEPRYTCSYCGKKTKTSSDLNIHVRIHTGEKPYKCHLCDASFAHGGNRLYHIRTRHQNLPPGGEKKLDAGKQEKRRKPRKKLDSSSDDSDYYDEPVKKRAKKSDGNKRSIMNKKKATNVKNIDTSKNKIDITVKKKASAVKKKVKKQKSV